MHQPLYRRRRQAQHVDRCAAGRAKASLGCRCPTNAVQSQQKPTAAVVALLQVQAPPVAARAVYAPASASLSTHRFGKPVHTAVAHSTMGAALTKAAGLSAAPPTAHMALLALWPRDSLRKALAAEARRRRRTTGAMPLTPLPQVAAALWLAAKTRCVFAPLRLRWAIRRERAAASAALAAAMLVRRPRLPATSAPTLRAQLADLNSACPMMRRISLSSAALDAITLDLPGERSRPNALRPLTSRLVPWPTAILTWLGGPAAKPAKSSTTFQTRSDGMSARTTRMRRRTRTFAADVAALHPAKIVPCTWKKGRGCAADL